MSKKKSFIFMYVDIYEWNRLWTINKIGAKLIVWQTRVWGDIRRNIDYHTGTNWEIIGCASLRTKFAPSLDNIAQREFNKAPTWTLRRTWLEEMDVERVQHAQNSLLFFSYHPVYRASQLLLPASILTLGSPYFPITHIKPGNKVKAIERHHMVNFHFLCKIYLNRPTFYLFLWLFFSVIEKYIILFLIFLIINCT